MGEAGSGARARGDEIMTHRKELIRRYLGLFSHMRDPHKGLLSQTTFDIIQKMAREHKPQGREEHGQEKESAGILAGAYGGSILQVAEGDRELPPPGPDH